MDVAASERTGFRLALVAPLSHRGMLRLHSQNVEIIGGGNEWKKQYYDANDK
jgi:hypothetical protein